MSTAKQAVLIIDSEKAKHSCIVFKESASVFLWVLCEAEQWKLVTGNLIKAFEVELICLKISDGKREVNQPECGDWGYQMHRLLIASFNRQN